MTVTYIFFFYYETRGEKKKINQKVEEKLDCTFE